MSLRQNDKMSLAESALDDCRLAHGDVDALKRKQRERNRRKSAKSHTRTRTSQPDGRGGKK